jgi:hypothetical protein
MSIASCAARSRPICRCSFRQNDGPEPQDRQGARP